MIFDQEMSLESKLQESGQSHVLDFIHENESEVNNKSLGCEVNSSNPMVQQLNSINIVTAVKHFQQAQSTKEPIADDSILPVTAIKLNESVLSDIGIQVKDIGETSIKNGQVAAVILSGGQGTRLGHNGPKGMFTLPSPSISKKSIFQIHIERLLSIRRLSQANSVPVYIMTSDLNDQIIRDYFKQNNYFNYPEKDVYFFQQGLMPCFDLNGKIIIESPHSLSLAPDGNGGIYEALQHTGAYDDMKSRGVKYIHVYGIDNILTKSLDPLFLGLCISKNIQCGNKVVWRSNKAEKVGLTVNINNHMHILEYSEMPVNIAESENKNIPGELAYGAANICNHFLSMSFLSDVVFPNLSSFYHIALKKIPFYDLQLKLTITPSSINGSKLEMFIFDVFPLADSDKWLVTQVNRDDEFAPIKNANDPSNVVDIADSPFVATKLISNQAKRWLQQVNAILVYSPTAITKEEQECVICEISPLLSYAGEGLEKYANTVINLPCYLS